MPNFKSDWLATEKLVRKELNGNPTLAKFVDDLFDRFGAELAKQIETVEEGVCLCDQYVAIHQCQLITLEFLGLVRAGRWPTGSEVTRDNLGDVLRGIRSECKPLKKLVLKAVQKIKPEKLLLVRKWAQVRPTNINTKPLDLALKAWHAATKGNYVRVLESAQRKSAAEKTAASNKLSKLCQEIASAAGDLDAKHQRRKDQKASCALLERMQQQARKVIGFLEESSATPRAKPQSA